ncbi:60S ribosomal protein [Vigna angularis]|uniref:60S ribosomal protein n=1 Tax=Phaseolus angularis TaxID=3914 RepID=A0A8T0L444_PHAAN|nr:60S ribosomal protein [Vigna angularis]
MLLRKYLLVTESQVSKCGFHIVKKRGDVLYLKRTKFSKYCKDKCSRGCKPDGTKLGFGRYGTQSCRAGRLSYRATEAARRAIIGHFHRAMSGQSRKNDVTGKPGGRFRDIADLCIPHPALNRRKRGEHSPRRHMTLLAKARCETLSPLLMKRRRLDQYKESFSSSVTRLVFRGVFRSGTYQVQSMNPQWDVLNPKWTFGTKPRPKNPRIRLSSSLFERAPLLGLSTLIGCGIVRTRIKLWSPSLSIISRKEKSDLATRAEGQKESFTYL